MEDTSFTVITSMRYEFPSKPFPDSTLHSAETPDLSLRAHADRLDRSTRALGWNYDASKSSWPASDSLHLKALYLKHNIDRAIFVALEASEWPCQITQDELQQRWSHEPIPNTSVPIAFWRVRIDLSDPSRRGSLKFTIAPLPPVTSPLAFDHFQPERLPSAEELVSTLEPTWTIYISQKAVTPNLHTRHKTSERGVYDEAREGIRPNVEMLLCNADGEIMDGTISTPYFFKDGAWITPATSCGGLDSVTRRYALLKGLAIVASIKQDELRAGMPVLLSNSVRGWGWGRLETQQGG